MNERRKTCTFENRIYKPIGVFPENDEYLKSIMDYYVMLLETSIYNYTDIDPTSFIKELPDGYKTVLTGTEQGTLSGGQKQRIAIARALYGFPKYIVMDEPNANLDEVGEAVLVQAIQFLKSHGATIVITTHRPRLVGAVERLLVMREGLQVGFGPAEEMLNAVRNLQVVPTTPESKQPQDGDSVVANPTVLESNS
jgi:ABC-type multidrug transport system ATPase subunit